MKEKKKLTRKEQSVITKNKLLDAAFDLFGEFEHDKVSVEMITKKAGVSKGSFYVHFNSKKTLITKLTNYKLNEVDMDYETFVNSLPDDKPISEILLSLVDKIMDVMRLVIGYEQARVMYEVLLDKSEDISEVVSSSRKLNEIIYSVVKKGIESGEFRTDMSAISITTQLLISLRGLTYQWCVLYPDFDLNKSANEHMKLMLNGILK